MIYYPSIDHRWIHIVWGEEKNGFIAIAHYPFTKRVSTLWCSDHSDIPGRTGKPRWTLAQPQPALTCGGHVMSAVGVAGAQVLGDAEICSSGVAARWDDSTQFSQPWIPNIEEGIWEGETGSIQDSGSTQSVEKWDSYEGEEKKFRCVKVGEGIVLWFPEGCSRWALASLVLFTSPNSAEVFSLLFAVFPLFVLHSESYP